MKALCAVILAALPAGCALPRYPPPAPELQVPAHWRSEVGPGAPVEQGWWRSFNDPQLSALVQLALERNDEIRTAQARLQEYRARITVAASGQQPVVTAGFMPSKTRSIGPFGQPIQLTAYQTGLQASYELDVFGKLAATTAAARFDYQAQQAAYDATALSVAASVATGYLRLRGLDAELDLARATLESRKRSLELARRQFDVGYLSRLELAQAEGEYRSTAGTIPQVERAIDEQENALSLLLGANPGPVTRGAPLDQINPPAIAAGLPSALLRRRPDIAQAERTIASADASLAAARDRLLPSITFSLSTAAYGTGVSSMLKSPVALWAAGGSVLAPVFDSGRLRAQADIAASMRERAILAYESAVRTAFAETENALAGIRLINEQLIEAEARRQATAEALRIAHNRYLNGYASYLEELDAQRNLFNAETNVIQLRTTVLGAHVDLYRALGGGWTPGP